jgi:glycosyltransferase involved in cell wall biosynthesis
MNLAINGLRLMGRRCGVGRYIEYLLRYWAGMKPPFDRVILYTPGAIEDPVILPDFVEHRIIRSFRSYSYWEQVALPRRHDPKDLLFCPSYVAPLAARGKIALTHHGSYEAIPEAFPFLERWKSRLIFQLSAMRADSLITVSQSSKANIIKFYGIAPEKIKVIHVGVDPSFRPLTESDPLKQTREKYLGADRPYILFVGKLSKRRNIPQMIAAFARVKKKHRIPHALLIIGPDPIGQNVPRLAREQEVGDSVFHHEFASHEELIFVYNAAELFMYPSSYEGFGMPVIEAMACGVPTITLSNSSLLESAEGAAYLAEDGSVDQLYSALEAVLFSPALRERMRADGIDRAKDFGWEPIARQTLDALAEVAQA